MPYSTGRLGIYLQGIAPLSEPIRPMSPREAKSAFLDAHSG